MIVIKTMDKDGREVFTYLNNTPSRDSRPEKRKRHNESIRITLKLPH